MFLLQAMYVVRILSHLNQKVQPNHYRFHLPMKNYSITKIIILLFLIFVFAALKSNAYTGLNNILSLNFSILDQNSLIDYNIEVQKIMAEILQENKVEKFQVEIFDHDFNIIAFGNETDTKINSLLRQYQL